MSKVNLDALIPREDFISDGNKLNKQSRLTNITLSHLLKGYDTSIYHLLKKPDFQRETNEWDKKRIAELIECFIERSFIPSIILWENQESGNIFVIDGAHRLSAIIAYINDDYGDNAISAAFYGVAKIPQEEVELAKETRIYINKTIGSYADVIKENGYKANGLRLNGFELQMITGDVKKAEDSFFKINQQGVVLSPSEKELCKSREMPSCIATRAIIKGGAGTQYWKNFEANNQSNVKIIAEELNTLLFKPPYNENTKSVILHHPLGGSITNATPMIFDLMKIIKAHHKQQSDKEEDDTNSGSETLNYLKWTRKIIWKIFSEQEGSLGLFPSVYFYNSGSKYVQSAFLGIVQLLIENENNENFLPKFTKVRGSMENFLVNHKILITQINRKFGSKERSYRHMKGFFMNLIDIIYENQNEIFVLNKIKEQYQYLNERESEVEDKNSKRFTKDQKVLLGIKEELKHMPKCKICGGHLHPLSKSYDHIIDKKFGGSSNDFNAQSTHHYCNNSKDKLIALGIYNLESL